MPGLPQLVADGADASTEPAHDGFRHEAYLFHDLDEFLAETVPFVLDGVRAGQPVMVAITPERLAVLRSALGRSAERVLLLDMHQLGSNPGRIIPSWRAFIDDYPEGTPVRGMGEPIWTGRRDAELVECQLHEALLNVAISPQTPLWLRCPYDASALADDLVQEAQRSHPMMVEGERYRGSTVYGGRAHVDDLMARALPAPSAVEETREFSRKNLRGVRESVGRWAAAAGLAPDRCDDLTLVIHEIATNSVRHGGGAGTLRIWREPGDLVVEICDTGQLEDALAGRWRSPDTDEGGRGLWLAQQMADLVQIRRSPQGTTVRIHAWLS
ncbi:MAG TPA: sensor histidine kinase [Frankiaceae bacterium]|nr:sensor histidine kinase [Frankiaceae bacterium]